MSIPWHGPFCKTWSYRTSCRYCRQTIFVMQCTCGSAVLFEHLGQPWPKHVCAGWRPGEWSGAGAAWGGRTSIPADVVTNRIRREGKSHGNIPIGTWQGASLRRMAVDVLSSVSYALSTPTQP